MTRVTIRQLQDGRDAVFELTPEGAYEFPSGERYASWRVLPNTQPMFAGTFMACHKMIRENGYIYMTEHGIPTELLDTDKQPKKIRGA